MTLTFEKERTSLIRTHDAQIADLVGRYNNTVGSIKNLEHVCTS